MPNILSRAPKIDPAGIYVGLDSAVTKAGEIREGARYRGTDPVVQATPTLFIADGASDEEAHAAYEAYAGPALDAAVASLPHNLGFVDRPTPPAAPKSPVGLVVAKADIPRAFLPGGPYAPIAAGTVVSASSPVAKARARDFRPATMADLEQKQ